MKKIKYVVFLFLIMFFPREYVLAAPSATMSCSASRNVTVGDIIKVTVRGNATESVYWDTTFTSDNTKLRYVGGSQLRSISDDASSSITLSYSFRALAEGTAKVSSSTAIANASGQENGYFTSNCTINIGKKVEKSSDNALKNLGIEGIKLTPEFNKDVLEYSATMESDNDTTINIKADPNDSKSSITGGGNQNAILGLNKLSIVVTAESGTTRTYVINLNVKEKNPITKKINGIKYTLLRKVSETEIPSGFEKFNIKIEDKDVEAFKNDMNTILVVFIDKNNKTYLFSYDEEKNKFEKYLFFKNSNLSLVLNKPNKTEIPYKYKKSIFLIGEQEVEGYTLSEGADFRLIYAMNMDTKEKSFYLYDLKENTFQRFYNEQVNIYIELMKKCKIALVIIIGLFAILSVTLVCLFTTNHKTKKKINKYTEQVNKL